MLESLQRGANEGVKVDNLSLEVNSSRHAYAVTSTQVIQVELALLIYLIPHSCYLNDPPFPGYLCIHLDNLYEQNWQRRHFGKTFKQCQKHDDIVS